VQGTASKEREFEDGMEFEMGMEFAQEEKFVRPGFTYSTPP
jgi:hypothetical protein